MKNKQFSPHQQHYQPGLSHQNGISIIELMIALLLSSMLMLGVMRMFVDSLDANSTDNALAQVQDSARIAMEMIKRDVRMAGYKGTCADTNAQFITQSLFDLNVEAIRGVEGGNTVSDSLSILRGEELIRPNNIAAPQGDRDVVRVISYDSDITVDRNICYDSSDLLMVTDCEQFTVFNPLDDQNQCNPDPALIVPSNIISRGVGASGAALKDFVISGNCDAANLENCPLLMSIGSPLGIGSPPGIFYDIQNTGRTAFDGQSIMALFRNNIEMVEGIDNLQITYGIRTANGTQYTAGCTQSVFTAGTCNLGEISHIRISILVSSNNNVSSINAVQDFPIVNLDPADQTLQFNDRRLRKGFSTTIQVRN